MQCPYPLRLKSALRVLTTLQNFDSDHEWYELKSIWKLTRFIVASKNCCFFSSREQLSTPTWNVMGSKCIWKLKHNCLFNDVSLHNDSLYTYHRSIKQLLLLTQMVHRIKESLIVLNISNKLTLKIFRLRSWNDMATMHLKIAFIETGCTWKQSLIVLNISNKTTTALIHHCRHLKLTHKFLQGAPTQNSATYQATTRYLVDCSGQSHPQISSNLLSTI